MSDSQADGEIGSPPAGSASSAPARESSASAGTPLSPPLTSSKPDGDSSAAPLSPPSRNAAAASSHANDTAAPSSSAANGNHRDERSRSRERERSDAAASSSLSSRVSHRRSARKLYVGNLAATATEADIVDMFAKSPIPCALPSQVDMKTGYAFVVSRQTDRRQAAVTASLLHGHTV